jgi:uncharacterized membrane protein YfcA
LSPQDSAAIETFLLALAVWRKKSQNWPLWVGLAPIGFVASYIGLALALGLPARLGMVCTVVLVIGVAKLAIAAFGRGNVLAASRLKAGQPAPPVHGLVESRDDV